MLVCISQLRLPLFGVFMGSVPKCFGPDFYLVSESAAGHSLMFLTDVGTKRVNGSPYFLTNFFSSNLSNFLHSPNVEAVHRPTPQ